MCRVERELTAYKRGRGSKGIPDFLGYHSTVNHSVRLREWTCRLMSMQYLIFGRIEGLDLQQFMQQREFKPLEEHLVKRIMQSVINTVLYCHSLGIAHRDIKLENVMIQILMTN